MLARFAPALAIPTLVLSTTLARADKVPPPPAPHIVVTRVAAETCGQGDKDIPCSPAIVDATQAAAVAIGAALGKTPIACRGEKAGKHAAHLYWGDGFGSVVHIDFDQEAAGLPDCSGDLVHLATDRLTDLIRPIGNKDETLRIHWTVDFALEH